MSDAALEAGLAEAAPARESAGWRALQAVFYAFVLWIPIETLVVFDANSRDPQHGGITISKILGLLLFALAIVEWRRAFERIPATFWMIVWYAGVLALSELWVPRWLGGKFRANELTLVQMVGMFVIASNLLRDSKYRASLLRFYGWWSALVALSMILGVFGHQFEDVEGRFTLLGEDPNFTAGMFALGAVCIAGNRKLREARYFLLRLGTALLALGALTAAILDTGSRGGLLSFTAGILGLTLCGSKSSRHKRLLLGGGLVILLSGMVAEEFARGSTTAHRLQRSWDEGDTAGRTEIWTYTREMIAERPLLGYGGVNNFYTLGSRLNFDQGGFYYRDTHNLLYAVLTEVGLIGGVPFFAAMCVMLWLAWRYGGRSDDGVPFALMCVLFTMNASITGYHQKIFWVVAAAAVACGLDSGVEEPAEAVREEAGVL